MAVQIKIFFLFFFFCETKIKFYLSIKKIDYKRYCYYTIAGFEFSEHLLSSAIWNLLKQNNYFIQKPQLIKYTESKTVNFFSELGVFPVVSIKPIHIPLYNEILFKKSWKQLQEQFSPYNMFVCKALSLIYKSRFFLKRRKGENKLWNIKE